jgi:hypothetical protein
MKTGLISKLIAIGNVSTSIFAIFELFENGGTYRTFEGKACPIADYYYIIDLNNGSKLFTRTLTIRIKMKKKLIFFGLMLLIASMAKAQVPQGIPYQAVTRNAQGQPLASTNVKVRFSILDSIATGTAIYIEAHSLTTTSLGLFTANVGMGTASTGIFNNINWGQNFKFLKVEIDTTATGNNYIVLGTQQMMSVPYALYAREANSVSGGSGGSGGGNFTHYIGEIFGGGVIFHLWKDAQGIEHGLIVDKTDLSTSQIWSNVDQTLIGTSAQSSWDGLGNSNAIVGQAGHTNSAAALCLNSTNGGQSDWYLPAIDELERLFHNKLEVNASLRTISGATELERLSVAGGVQKYYWSSTEYSYIPNVVQTTDAYNIWFEEIYFRDVDHQGKFSSTYVRAVRAF